MFSTWYQMLDGDLGTWAWQVGMVPLTLMSANAFEWAWHKYVLHGLGKNPKSFWNFHWGDHHRNVRRNGFYDLDYQASLLRWNAQGKELFSILLGGLIISPLFFFAPLIYFMLVYSGLRYYFVHRRSHLDPEWARKKVPWHYDHHMGANQNANWCVTHPWCDDLFKTRISSPDPILHIPKKEARRRL